MNQATDGVKVSIMGREFSVACKDDQRNALSEAAIHLDNKMREIHKTGKIIGMEKCAIMAALNITHELLMLKTRDEESKKLDKVVFEMLEKIDVAISEQQQLSI